MSHSLHEQGATQATPEENLKCMIMSTDNLQTGWRKGDVWLARFLDKHDAKSLADR